MYSRIPLKGTSEINEALLCKSLGTLNNQLPNYIQDDTACSHEVRVKNWSNHKLECALYEIAPHMAPHLEFGQLDKSCADLMIDESAKSYQA